MLDWDTVVFFLLLLITARKCIVGMKYNGFLMNKTSMSEFRYNGFWMKARPSIFEWRYNGFCQWFPELFSFFLCHILLKVISSKTHTSNQFLIACFIQRVEHHCNHNCHVTMPPCRSTLGRHICHITSHTTLAWHMLYFPLMLPSGTTLGLSVSYSPLLLPTNTILREHTLYSPLLLP